MSKELPTLEKFKKDMETIIGADFADQEFYKCPKCGHGVKKDYSVAYLTAPPRFRYFCSNPECNYMEIL